MESKETVPAMLRAYESTLPLNNAFVGSILKSLAEQVVPVINLANYDDGPQGFGRLLDVSYLYKTQTSAGAAKQHKYSFTVPQGQVWIVKHLVLQAGAIAAFNWYFHRTNPVQGTFNLYHGYNIVQNSNTMCPLVGPVSIIQETLAAGVPSYRTIPELTLYPRDTLEAFSDAAAVGIGLATQLHAVIERYASAVALADRSSAVTGTMV